MKTNKNLSIFLPLVVAMVTLVGCSDYDNGFTEKVIKFHSDFTEQFGSFDKEQDWNLADRASVTVITSELKDVDVYMETDGQYVQVGAFKNVTGTQKLEFDMIESLQNLVVSDGDVALRAFVGGTVNFDDMTSVEGEAQGTRGGEYVERNHWARDYVVPANITQAESLAVVAAFSQPHYGAYNSVLVPWTQMFVQQVHKGTSSYFDGFNQQIITASDYMNRLMMWDNSSEYAQQHDNGYIHVNDFNAGSQTADGYDDNDINHEHPYIGITMMRDVDPTNCPTETVKDPDGNDVVWVKQFSYHNSESNEYQPTYIMKRVTWTENGEEKSGLYLGFDFYANNPDGQDVNKNMDVRRDWVFNDWIIKVSQALDVSVPIRRLDNAAPTSWILAGEDLGGSFDIDYNDVVVRVEHVSGQENATVTPLAAGGTLASYLFFERNNESVCIGEIHQLLGATQALSGSYGIINMEGNVLPGSLKTVKVGTDWSIAEDISLNNNMGGFTIKVLPQGANPVDPSDPDAFNDATIVSAPQRGEAPFIICVPGSYTLANVPSAGQKTTSVWAWPREMTHIETAYDDFKYWVANHNDKSEWYTNPNADKIVSTASLANRFYGTQPQTMSNDEVETSQDPNLDVSFIGNVPTYPVRAVPAYSIALKPGVSEITINVDETFDMLDYIETSYPNDVYCTTQGNSDIALVEGSNTVMRGLLGGKHVLVTVKLDDPSGQKTLDVYVNVIGDAGFAPMYYDSQSSTTINLTNQSINIPANSEIQVQLSYQNTNSANITANITNNGSGSTVSVNGNALTVRAGSVSGKTETITLNFQPEGYYKSVTTTFNINVTAAPKQDSNMSASASSNTLAPGGTITINTQNSKGSEITYEVTPSNAGVMNGNQFTANTNYTGNVSIKVIQAATDMWNEGQSIVYVTVQKLQSNLSVRSESTTVVAEEYRGNENYGIDLKSLVTTSSTGNITYKIYNDGFWVNESQYGPYERAYNASYRFWPDRSGTLTIKISQAADNQYEASDEKICYVEVTSSTNTEGGSETTINRSNNISKDSEPAYHLQDIINAANGTSSIVLTVTDSPYDYIQFIGADANGNKNWAYNITTQNTNNHTKTGNWPSYTISTTVNVRDLENMVQNNMVYVIFTCSHSNLSVKPINSSAKKRNVIRR